MALTDGEFSKVLHHLNKNSGVFNKAKTLRDRMKLTKDDGETVYLEFFDAVDPLRNRWQVTMEGRYRNRYDVMILCNGLPVTQIELKRRGLEMKEAFNQIQRYQKHTFWSGHGLFHFVQLFVISNGVNTKYYANARRQSFKQTFYWAAEDNTTIRELAPFADAFLNREHLGTMIGKYIVLNETEKILMVLRPYQYYATEAIVERVRNPPPENANGYIWHTTGSGKTLTSFKAAQILTGLPGVCKVVFCVDRKDLDYKTISDFNDYSKGSVDGTDNTTKLVKQFNEVTLELRALTPTVRSVKDLPDEEAELKFVKIFRELMRLRNILESFSEFEDEDLTLTAQLFADYRSAYLDLYDKVKTDHTKEKTSILEDVDFELELIHRDVINVQYILTLLAKLYDADPDEQKQLRKLILDSVAGDLELRSKRELIEKFIERNLPQAESAAEIPECFEDFWEKERVAAFEQLVKEEQLDADRLKQVIDRYVYTGEKPLPDPDIVELITKQMGVLERGPARKRVFEKVVGYVETFIRGIAA